MRGRIAPLVVALLLPLFFAFTGLRTRMDLLGSEDLWGLALTSRMRQALGSFCTHANCLILRRL